MLLNDPFEVNDLEEVPDKFDVRVDNNDKDAVEGVNAATTAVQQRFNFFVTLSWKFFRRLIDRLTIGFIFFWILA